jgi:hypothetical protein
MSDDYSSGESRATITVRSAGEALLIPSDDLSPEFTNSSPSRVAITSIGFLQQYRKTGGKAHPFEERDRRMPEGRDAIRRLWRDAQQKTAEMVLASKSESLIELSNAASDLDQILGEMWDLREFREIDWRGVLDFLQGVLRYVWKIGGGYEKLSNHQCEAIEEVIKNHLGPSTMDKEDVRSTLKILRTAGLDPWAVISGDPEE